MYSAFKRAILDTEQSEVQEMNRNKRRRVGAPGHALCLGLRALAVVDRALKPHYLLESAPRVTQLALDWQQELSFPPFLRYAPDWFSTMLRGASWASLSVKLTRCDSRSNEPIQ